MAFLTIIPFDSLDVVGDFAGEDYEAAFIPDKDMATLSHFDQQAHHYEVREEGTVRFNPYYRIN